MANELLTVDDITRESQRVLHQKLNFVGSCNRQYDESFKKKGAQIGDELRIRLPNKYKVRHGAVLDTQDTKNRSTTLPVKTQAGVDLNFSSVDLTLHIDEFSKNIIKPAMSVLAADIEADAMSMYKDVYNQIDNIGLAATFKKILMAGKVLTDNLTPYTDRCLNMNTLDNIDVVDAISGKFNDQKKIAKAYREGRLGSNSFGFEEIFENTLWPRHTTGSCAAVTAYLVNGANQTGSALNVDTGANTFKAGDIITIEGVNRVHPETKTDTGELQTFVITSDYAGGAGNLAISPAIVSDATDGEQNVTASPADNAPISKQGGANASHGLSMAFHQDAFAFATADLIMPEGVDFAKRMVLDGISMRVVRQYDINNDKFPCRVDVLYGYKTIMAELAARLANN